MSRPSDSMTLLMSEGDSLTGDLSLISMILTFAKRDSRFKYSPIPSRKYFSFILPTAMIVIFNEASD